MSDPQLNICFHGIGTPQRDLEPDEERYWIAADEYLRILDEIMGWPRVSISFDDGNASDVEIGVAALRERGLTAQFFVLAGRLDTPGSLGSTDLVDLRRAGMTVGTHGMDHRPWRGMDQATQNRELVEARRRISDVTGAPVTVAALPLGQYDRSLLSALRALDYAGVYTSDRRAARPGQWLRPRFSVVGTDTAASLRETVLRPPGARTRLELRLKAVVKQLR